MKETNVRAALIGCGDISKAHLKSMLEAGLTVVALCDIVESKAEARKKEFNLTDATVYRDYREMLAQEKPEVTGVATPPICHRTQTVDALHAGSHVYCEKPVGRCLNEMRDIAAAENETGRRAFYTTCRRRGYEGEVVKQFIEDGDLGDVYRVGAVWTRDRGRPGVDFLHDARWFADASQAITGISGDLGMYVMDRMFYYTNWPRITSVSAQTWKAFDADMPADCVYDVEEHIFILARTQGQLAFTFEFANIAHKPPEDSFQILGTKGGISTRPDGKPVLTAEKGGPWRFVETAINWSDREDGDTKVYRGLKNAVLEETPPADAVGTTTAQAEQFHAVLQASFVSMKERREVRIDELEPSLHIYLGTPVT